MKAMHRIALEVAHELRARADRMEALLAREENEDVVAEELVAFLKSFVANYPLRAIMRSRERGR